ncbi:MAG: tetratricopeptide repeat protein [Chthoniobacterales bacterium]
MALKTENELGAAQRALWLKAVAAVELRNFAYAISLLQELLRQEPQFLTARQLMRRTEVTKFKAAKKSFFNLSSAPIALRKAQRELKMNSKHAVELIEKVLEDDPYNRAGNLLLKKAAMAAGWPETGVFALQTLLEQSPRDISVLRELAQLYHDLGENEKEVGIYNRITEIDPIDAQALRRGKDASARASMKSGGWNQAGSYRDLIKDKEAAVLLEQQNRMQLTGEPLDRRIAETLERQKTEPESLDHARQLGSLYEQKEDFDHAAIWYEYAAGLTQNSDAGLARKVSELKGRRWQREIAEQEEFVAYHGPEHPEFAQRIEALRVAKRQRAENSIADARLRSERNPTDLQLRFDLGEHLLNAGRFREALPELQRARQNPNARLRAMNLLGRCYRELAMYDLAAKQLEEAAREIQPMDAMKKEIVYDLGLVYEEMGEQEKSIAAMKQIYEADYGYRDVARRVESSYDRTKQ